MKEQVTSGTKVVGQTTRPNKGLVALSLEVAFVWVRNERAYLTGYKTDGTLATVRVDRIVPFTYGKDGKVEAVVVEKIEMEKHDLNLAVMPGFSAQYGFVEEIDDAGKALLVQFRGGRPISDFVVDSVEVAVCSSTELEALNAGF